MTTQANFSNETSAVIIIVLVVMLLRVGNLSNKAGLLQKVNSTLKLFDMRARIIKIIMLHTFSKSLEVYCRIIIIIIIV